MSSSERAVELQSSYRALRKNRNTKKILLKIQKNMLMPSFHPFELVWAYIRGFPTWPGVIEEISVKGNFIVHFFGDYSTAEVPRKNIIHYFEGFSQFAENYGNIKLRKAVEEAKIFLMETNDKNNECFVCKVLNTKKKITSLKTNKLQVLPK